MHEKYPLYYTQGGGLARLVTPKRAVLVQKPDCPELEVGDDVPSDWVMQPANTFASEVDTNSARWSEETHEFEHYPYPSVPWNKEEDGSAAFDKAPDSVHLCL